MRNVTNAVRIKNSRNHSSSYQIRQCNSSQNRCCNHTTSRFLR